LLHHIQSVLQNSIDTKAAVLADEALLERIGEVVMRCTATFEAGGKVLFCGNGGSAADAQHLAAEFSGRFYTDRNPLPSEALHCNSSYMTAVGNDYGFDVVYSRAVRGHGKAGDVLIGLSTSGNSENIVKAFETAREMGLTTVALTGKTGGRLAPLSDYLLNMPSTDTPRIQECHITVGHIICELVESNLFPTLGV
jgi:D-sedoheptulose 7-phosphate isomerase